MQIEGHQKRVIRNLHLCKELYTDLMVLLNALYFQYCEDWVRGIHV